MWGDREGFLGSPPVEVTDEVGLEVGRGPPQHQPLGGQPLPLARLPLQVGVAQGHADVRQQPGQRAQLQQGLLGRKVSHVSPPTPSTPVTYPLGGRGGWDPNDLPWWDTGGWDINDLPWCDTTGWDPNDLPLGARGGWDPSDVP